MSRPKSGRWADAYDRCQDCGRSDRPHKGHGLCAVCHKRFLRVAAPPHPLPRSERRAARLSAPYREPWALTAFHMRRLSALGVDLSGRAWEEDA